MAASNKQSGPAGPSIVRMTGFGVDRPTADNEIPIDINYAKLVDWLVGACWAVQQCPACTNHPGSHAELPQEAAT
jgi:hypothetical protein